MEQIYFWFKGVFLFILTLGVEMKQTDAEKQEIVTHESGIFEFFDDSRNDFMQVSDHPIIRM